MLIWPLAAILEKNKLANDKPFLVLCKMVIPGLTDPVYLARNNQNVTWNGKEWVAFPMKIGNVTSDGKTLPSVDFSVSNVGGLLQKYLQQNSGFVDAKVTWYVVHENMLDVTKPLIKLEFEVNSTNYSADWITLNLTCSMETYNQFPACSYLAHYCPYRFKSVRCGYNGTEEPCNNTRDTCRIPSRFGGEEGLSGNGS